MYNYVLIKFKKTLAMIFDSGHRNTGNKPKNQQMGLHQIRNIGKTKLTINKQKRPPKWKRRT
jgi:hypothetical protein